MTRRRLFGPAAIAAFALIATAFGASPAIAVGGQTAVAQAIGAPGSASHQGQSRKDCVGTARNTTSKIWFTVAGGVLSDVYAPTVDATNVQTLQYIVTDGSSFTDLQTRDTTYTAASDLTGMICTVQYEPAPVFGSDFGADLRGYVEGIELCAVVVEVLAER